MNDRLNIGIMLDRAQPTLGLHGLHTAFHGLPGIRIAGIVDSVEEGVEEIRQMLGAERRYRTMKEMLDSEKIDIVVITSRNADEHAEQIRLALRYGCNIYCEKPLVTDLKEADDLRKEVERAGIKFCMAHPGRYATPFQTVRKILNEKKLGRILSVETYGKCDHRGGGEDMMTLGTHLLDLMIFFFGKPESVFAELQTQGRPALQNERTKTVESIGPCAGDEIFATFRFSGGIRGTFSTYRDLFHYDGKTATNMGLSIIGSEGVVSARFTDIVPDFPVRFCRTRYPAVYGDLPFEELPDDETRQIPGALPLDENYLKRFPIPKTKFFQRANRFAAWDLIEAIRNKREPISNIQNACQTLEMIYGVYASHISGKKIHFPLDNRNHPLENKRHSDELA